MAVMAMIHVLEPFRVCEEDTTYNNSLGDPYLRCIGICTRLVKSFKVQVGYRKPLFKYSKRRQC